MDCNWIWKRLSFINFSWNWNWHYRKSDLATHCQFPSFKQTKRDFSMQFLKGFVIIRVKIAMQLFKFRKMWCAFLACEPYKSLRGVGYAYLINNNFIGVLVKWTAITPVVKLWNIDGFLLFEAQFSTYINRHHRYQLWKTL